jgi:hypothetical protein
MVAIIASPLSLSFIGIDSALPQRPTNSTSSAQFVGWNHIFVNARLDIALAGLKCIFVITVRYSLCCRLRWVGS